MICMKERWFVVCAKPLESPLKEIYFTFPPWSSTRQYKFSLVSAYLERVAL